MIPAVEAGNVVVVVLVDTLRPDHVGAWGYDGATLPEIDALARRGILFENARSVAPWTSPTIASIFQGRFPLALLPPSGPVERAGFGPLPPQPATLAEKASAAGVRTFGVCDHWGFRPSDGFSRGFGKSAYLPREVSGRTKQPPEVVVKSFESLLSTVSTSRFFGWLHILYPHVPLDAGPRWGGPPGAMDCAAGERRHADYVAAYDAEVRRADWVVGRVVRAIEAAGRAEDTWIVVVSDHGEAFWEHGKCGHGSSFDDEQLRAVLLVVPPRGMEITPGRVATPVSLIDLHPTLLEFVGVEAGEVDGRSLSRFLQPGAEPTSDPTYAEEPRYSKLGVLPVNPLAACVLEPPWKLVRDPGVRAGAPPRLFDLVADPGEKTDVAASYPLEASRLAETLRVHVERQTARRAAAAAPPSPVPLSPETRDRLRELGYLA